MVNLNIIQVKNELSVKCKNGLPFLISAMIIWSIIIIIFLQPFEIRDKNIMTFYSAALMLPLAALITKMMKAVWTVKNNPIEKLGLYLNFAQLMYFPLIFWAFIHSPESMIIFFAVITGAHLFPYGWYYNAKAYYVMAPIVSVIIIIIGEVTTNLWYVPLIMVISLLTLNVWLFVDYKKKKIKFNLNKIKDNVSTPS